MITKLNEIEIFVDVTYTKHNSRIVRSSTNIKGIAKESSVNRLDKTISFKAFYQRHEKSFKIHLCNDLERHLEKGWRITACRLRNEFIFPDNFFITKFLDFKIYDESIRSIVDIIAFVIRPKAKDYFIALRLQSQNGS